MKHLLHVVFRGAFSVASAVTLGAQPTPAPAPAANAGPAVELPPMMVEESVSSTPWLYVSAGGTEFLSRCSAHTTRHMAEAWLNKLQQVRALVPDEFMVQMDVPAVFVLYSQDVKQSVSAEIQRELETNQQGDSPRGERVNIALNMRLNDRDMHASIVYLDESQFVGSTLSVAPGHVRFLLKGRLPELPAWLVEGVERSWRRTDFVLEPIMLHPLVWNTSEESDLLAGDATRPRALLPANELFQADDVRALDPVHPRYAQTRAAQQELFFRWAVESGSATREAFWKLAARAAEGPVTEELFESLFGFDYAELRDRLADYLPRAVQRSVWVDPGPEPALPLLHVERATPNQIARLRGEWERLAIAHVQRRLPQVREPYVAQARRTLRRAFDTGDRDPRLLATMGLCEIDAGNEAGARQFLEPAVLAGVIRPRAYYELARLRFADLRRETPATKLFSFTDLAPVIDPLRRAVKQAPPLAEVYLLLAEAWSRCEFSPNREELAELEAGARLFAQRPAVLLPIARALARHGKTNEASALLDTTRRLATDSGTRDGISRLRAELAGTAAETPP